MTQNKKLAITITIFSLFYFYALAADLSIYLRGFAPYPHWIWPYTPAELTPKIILPIAITLLTIIFTRFIMNRTSKILKAHELLIILTICLISVVYQISILFASEGGGIHSHPQNNTPGYQRLLDAGGYNRFTK